MREVKKSNPPVAETPVGGNIPDNLPPVKRVVGSRRSWAKGASATTKSAECITLRNRVMWWVSVSVLGNIARLMTMTVNLRAHAMEYRGRTEYVVEAKTINKKSITYL